VLAEVASQLVGACEPPLATFPRATERTLTYTADNNTIIIITTISSSSNNNGGGNYVKEQSRIEKVNGV